MYFNETKLQTHRRVLFKNFWLLNLSKYLLSCLNNYSYFSFAIKNFFDRYSQKHTNDTVIYLLDHSLHTSIENNVRVVTSPAKSDWCWTTSFEVIGPSSCHWFLLVEESYLNIQDFLYWNILKASSGVFITIKGCHFKIYLIWKCVCDFEKLRT
jgi:hypothetical protein